MAVLYLQAFVFIILLGKLMRKIFFGQLRAAEMEHLIEKSWYAVTETCLAFTVFRDDFSPRFVAMFTLLLFLKCFHWLAEDRVDYMERSPVISFLFHTRVLSLLVGLGAVDLYFINHAYYSTLLRGASVQLVFGFEYAILLTVVLMTFFKYLLHSVDLQSENPWEGKAVYLLYTELFMGLIRVILYVLFMFIMIKVHTFPLFAVRPMYLAMRAFKKALHDVIMSRRAIRNMNTLYPDATAEDLASSDNVCIICREEMDTNCKKLPCNHIFHTSCLRTWFQRQQTCPTCRMDVLRLPRPQPPTPPPAQPAQPPMPPNMFQGFQYGWLPNQQPQPEVPPGQSSTASSTAPTTSTTNTPLSSPPSPPFLPPMMPPSPFMPFMYPQPPSSMSGLSIDELHTMEGEERSNIEARIQWLRDIQSLLDGAMLLIHQYNTVATQCSMPGVRIPNPSNTSHSNNNTSQQTDTKNTADVTLNSGSLGGARPKTTSLSNNTKQSSSPVKTEKLGDLSNLGATGFTVTKEEIIPEWHDPRKEEEEEDLHEVRKRRLQKFSSTEGTKADNIDLD
ncbi:hypothetical protein SNE40_010009 [Patella caerulea]|uniref:RING-type E3 ubiquitin transferase n=1 Tax=Patella caerulea TaxID=87958 RepID=A0AAN8Q409_PATCE